MKITYVTHGVGTQTVSEVRELEVKCDRIVIGRRDAQLTINDSLCSKAHAQLELSTNGDLLLTDLDSRNGTFVGEKRIKQMALHSGDAVRIGKTQLIILKVSTESKKTSQGSEPAEIMHSWPGTWQCVPGEKRKKFENYFQK